MSEELEQYHQKGGTYVIPVEIMNYWIGECEELQSVIDKAIEVFENEIKNLKEQKRLIMNILTPENGYLKADIDYEIKRLERYLEILRSKE